MDNHQRIHDFLDDLDEILYKGVALLDDVEVIRYQPRPTPTQTCHANPLNLRCIHTGQCESEGPGC